MSMPPPPSMANWRPPASPLEARISAVLADGAERPWGDVIEAALGQDAPVAARDAADDALDRLVCRGEVAEGPIGVVRWGPPHG